MTGNSLTIEEANSIIRGKIALHGEGIVLDIDHFLDLLRYSLSLDFFDKKKVVDSIPGLHQWQFDQLIVVFSDEREQFKTLLDTEGEEIRKMVGERHSEWLKLAEAYKIEDAGIQEAKNKEKEIADIKASL